MKVEIFQGWSDSKFQSFIELKERIQGKLETHFPEKLEDYSKILSDASPFSLDYEWVGFLVTRGTEVVAKAILSWRKKSSIGHIGFIDWVDDIEVARFLMNAMEQKARELKFTQVKTPVDLSFFIKYRIKMPNGGAPFYGEPIYPDYYHDLFKQTGYSIVGVWDTYKVDRWGIIRSFTKRRKQLKDRKHAHHDKVIVRNIRVADWENEMSIVYDLFNKSFSQMPEFEPITFEQFKLVYSDFKYIMHPLYSYIVELHGKPVGFSINYPDPLPVLKTVKGKTLTTIQKVLLLARLKLNYRTLLMAYVGKIPGPNGEEIKGVQIQTSKQLSTRGFFFGQGLVCYQSSDSPSRRAIDPSTIKEYSKYVLYGKDLK